MRQPPRAEPGAAPAQELDRLRLLEAEMAALEQELEQTFIRRRVKQLKARLHWLRMATTQARRRIYGSSRYAKVGQGRADSRWRGPR